jgi:hypothetical protein
LVFMVPPFCQIGILDNCANLIRNANARHRGKPCIFGPIGNW